MATESGRAVLTSHSGESTDAWQRVCKVLAWSFLILTTLCVFIPLSLRLPEAGLDPSWVLGMNQAVAQGLVFGRELVFTFGPYSSVYTLRYHPATDLLMLMGSAWLVLGWLAAVRHLDFQRSWLICALTLAVLLLTTRDQLFFSYCFIATLLVYRHYFIGPLDGCRSLLKEWSLVLVFIPLGLLPLVKISLLPSCVLASALACGMLLMRRQWGVSLVVLLVPILAAAGFWWGAGQPLDALATYIGNSGPIISAYTEAMSYWINSWLPLAYLLFCLAIAGLIAWRGPRGQWSRMVLLLLVAVYLFISFKAGFVRQEQPRVQGALAGLLFALLLLQPLVSSRLLWPLLTLGLLWYLYLASHGLREPGRLVASWVTPYSNAYQGVLQRWSEPQAYAEAFTRRLARIGREHPLPLLPGTVDIYSYDQATLLASGNRWAPRPVPQSYAAYAEPLLRRNARYLADEGAADYVLLRIQPIGGRYPALEDGASWMPLISRYLAYEYRDGLLFMRKRQQPAELVRHPVVLASYRLGDEVSLPVTDEALLARVRVQPTWLGKLSNVVFKNAPLSIEVTLKDGEQRRYKLISGMAASEFLLSPLIQDTQDFVYLTGKDAWMLEGSRVVSLRIVSAMDWLPLWQDSYQLELQSIGLPYDSRGGSLLAGERAQPVSEVADGQDNCSGRIDMFQVRPMPGEARLISVSGWVIGNAEKGEAAQTLFLQVTGDDGRVLVYPTQSVARPDVNRYFHRPWMGPVGYQVKIDVTGLAGEQQFSILRRYQGRLEKCQNITRSLSLSKAAGS